MLGLTIDDVDLENRLIIPNGARENGTTKMSWATCFNVEAETYLRKFREKNNGHDNRLMPMASVTVKRTFDRASKKTGIRITPQVLREWFCSQLGELGVPDRYVDALCGRTPKSVLARHYTDYSPEKLKRIYDKANLTVLSQDNQR